MGIGKRIGRIIKSNLNDLLSAAEDPEKQLDLLITEMEDSLRQAKQQLVEQLAMEKRLQRQLDETDELVKLWADKAQQAVNAGEDNLAREALRKRKTYEELATQYDQQLFEQQTAVDQLREQYKVLEQRLKEARARRPQITERVRRTRDASSPGIGRTDTGRVFDKSAFEKFEEMAEKVDTIEAETAARREIQEMLAPEEELSRRIDDAGRARTGASRGRTDEDLKIDIELEEMRKKAGRPEGASGGRLSRRRGAETEPPAPAEAGDKLDEGEQPPPEEGDGWGRRVEL